MQNSQAKLQTRYSNALDVSTRVDAGKMDYYIGTVEDLITSYDELKLMVELDLTNSSTSTLDILYQAMSTFTTLLQADVSGFSILLSKFEAFYNRGLVFVVHDFIQKFDIFATRMAKMSIDGGNNQLDADTIVAMRQFRDQFIQFQDTFATIIGGIYPLTSWTIDTVGQSLVTSCSRTIIPSFSASLASLVDLLEVNNKTVDSTSFEAVLDNAKSLAGCETQYETFLSTVRGWVDGVQLNASIRTPEVLLSIPDSGQLRTVLTNYSVNSISTVKFAEELMDLFKTLTATIDNVSFAIQAAETSFDSIVNAYQTSISTALGQLLIYLDALSLYNSYNDDIVNYGRNLKILMNPRPRISSSQVRIFITQQVTCYHLPLIHYIRLIRSV